MIMLGPILKESGADLLDWQTRLTAVIATVPADWTGDTYRAFDALIVEVFTTQPVTRLVGSVRKEDAPAAAFWKQLAGEPNPEILQPHVEHPTLIHSAGWWHDDKATPDPLVRFEWIRWPVGQEPNGDMTAKKPPATEPAT